MKTVLLLLAIVSLTVAQQPAMKKGRQVLADFRVDQTTNSAKISAATERMVLSKVFRRFLTDANQCDARFEASGSDRLAAARRAGQFVPSIMEAANGSFTAGGQSQTAYVIFVAECNASHADNFGSTRVAIFEGQQLIADVDAEFMSHIVRKTDLDSDGVNELLMTSGYTNQGTTIEMANLVSFHNGRRRVIQEFGAVVEDSCASGFPSSTTDASVLYISDIVPGSMPKLTQENYSSSCRKAKRWRLVSTGKRQE